MKTVEDILALAKNNRVFKIPPNIQEDASLREQGFDSLDMIMLLHEVETNFNVKIPNDQTSRLQSLQDIVHFLNEATITNDYPTHLDNNAAQSSPDASLSAALL